MPCHRPCCGPPGDPARAAGEGVVCSCLSSRAASKAAALLLSPIYISGRLGAVHFPPCGQADPLWSGWGTMDLVAGGRKWGKIPGPSTAPSLCHPAGIPPVASAPQPLQPRTSVLCQSLAAGPGHHGNAHAPSSLGAACDLPRGLAQGLPRPVEAVGTELPAGVPQPSRLPSFAHQSLQHLLHTAWLRQVPQQPHSRWAGSCGPGSGPGFGPGSGPGPTLPTLGCRTVPKLTGSTAFKCCRRLGFLSGGSSDGQLLGTALFPGFLCVRTSLPCSQGVPTAVRAPEDTLGQCGVL